MNRKTLLLIGIVFFIAAVILVGSKIYSSYHRLEFTNGNIIPDIRLPNQINDTLSLYSLKENIVLVQFWASWCGPCRMENRSLVNLYSRFQHSQMKDGGTFKIFSISVDKNPDAWKEAVVNDNMIWTNHVIDLKSTVAKTFNVNSIPTTFLIDQNGMIIGVNLSALELEKILEKRKK